MFLRKVCPLFVVLVLLSFFCAANFCSAIPLNEATSRAENGDHNAQSYLAHLFLTGKGVEKNHTMARYWYNRVIQEPAADARIIAHSQLILGFLHSSGLGGKRSYTSALDCFMAAAEQGYTDAHIYIGYIYAMGLGVKKDFDKALHWWKLAADEGHPKAPDYVSKLEKKMTCLPGKGDVHFTTLPEFNFKDSDSTLNARAEE